MDKKKEQKVDTMASMIVDGEYLTARANQDTDNSRFEALVDMLECKRTEKDYEWMSDYFDMTMNGLHHSEAAIWANQYFPTRDFVTVKLDGEDELDKRRARGAEKLINKTLNRRELRYYPKHIRRKSITSLAGQAYILANWEQEIERKPVEIKDQTGNKVKQEKKKIFKDCFNFEVFDPRNVFTDNKYCYSVQDKDWVIFRYDSTLEKLKAKEKENQYENLDLVKKALGETNVETQTAQDTYAKDADGTHITKTPIKYFDVIDRYGKFYAIVDERDEEEGFPTKISSPFNSKGEWKENVELVETITSYAIVKNEKILIRFIPTPFIDNRGRPFKPIARSICYIHPTKDCGLGDGMHMRETQVAINDTFNLGMDRVKLATLPTFKGRKMTLEDNLGEIYFEPEHVIPVENMDDLQEIIIKDNVNGALQQVAMLRDNLHTVTSIYPTSMGALPDKASTTATAIAGAETARNSRSSYKSLTDEYVFLQDFYWLILQMTHRFAQSETALLMMGEDAYYFDANADYHYTPLTSNIENEHNKQRKIQQLDQNIGRLSGLVKVFPQVIPIIAKMVEEIFILMGKEYQEFGGMIEQLINAKPVEEGKGATQTSDQNAPPTSNQNGMPMSAQEQEARTGQMENGGEVG